MLGLSVANVAGVPAATWIGQHLGWRAAFVSAAMIAVLSAALIAAYVPSTPASPDARGRAELRAFGNTQFLLTLLTGAIGFGGLFAVFSYISPTVTELGGLSEGAVPWFLLAFGLGMTLGGWLAGELGRVPPYAVLIGGTVSMIVVLLLFGLLAPSGWWALPALFLVAAVNMVVAINLQLRLMHVAGDSAALGAAMNHSSLNVANALGAWLGGLALTAGYGYRSTSVVGALLCVAGLAVLMVSWRLHRAVARA
jgi:MFS transporter, DHA1 family, inner membrane transport protein